MQLFVVAIVVAVTLAHPSFEEFKFQFNKVYASEMEEYFREQIYNTNVEYIDSFNQEGHSWTLDVNQFADLLHSEFKKQYLMPKQDFSHLLLNEAVSEVDVEALPASVDWRTKNAVTAVKDQGQCGGGCYAFSAIASLEGIHAINTGKLVALSEENIIECSSSENNVGCLGGLPTQSFEYVMKKGVDTEASYPYTSGTSAVVGKCKYNATTVGATITGYTALQAGSEADLQNATALEGPVAVSFDADHASFVFYRSGIYSRNNCSKTDLDWAMTVVGYGRSTAGYWIVKNSWGTVWGMEGFGEIARNDHNMCGIATQAAFPTGVRS